MDKFYITNPLHGGKVTCHKCNGFILEGDHYIYPKDYMLEDVIYFHKDCFNKYEHYYGLDKPLD